MASIVLRVNGQDRQLPPDANATLQFALRDDLGLTGTKFGCGVGQCGCCTVLIDGQPTRSCRERMGCLVLAGYCPGGGPGGPRISNPLRLAIGASRAMSG